MRALGYSLEQAIASVWRGRRASILPMVTIGLALCVLGAFLLLTLNVQRLVSAWEGTAELSVYLQDQASAAERGAVEQALGASPMVASHEYVSKVQARQRFTGLFPDLAGLTADETVNPFPASIEVRLRPGHETGGALDDMATRLRQMAGVGDIRYDHRWIARVVRAADVVGGLGLLLTFILSIAGALTVAAVVRLALFARRDEVEIMRLVGAPFSFIRGPFITEGVLHGGLGAILAVGLLTAALALARARYGAAAVAALGVTPVWFLPLDLCALLVVGGMAVGGIGGMVAAWSGR